MVIIKLSRRIIQILTVSSILSLFPISSYAYNDITIEPSFTYEDGLWKPGRVESKDFYINNNKENDISIDRLYMSLKSSEYWKTGEELDINSAKFKEFAKYSTVTLKHNNNVLFKDKFENLLSKDGINLSKDIYIKSNRKELLNMTIDMNLEMNNDAQALNNVFTIGVAYKMDEDTTPPINPDEPSNPDIDNPINPDKPANPGNDVDVSQSGKLPQTGGIINGDSLVVLGTVVIGTGFVLNKKSSKEKGGKHHE
ncbi:anchor protein [[Clostridium] sordellii]|uniref:LPXTG cell wall anchor domain-containing protein n=1 Tax=Paraclostridium sordellii TaxID=1505 RepID=UPI0005E07D59|nr:LPXTG cell wall anchor domain-containing protein [Paeniclostridium sordellii]MDU1455703.1 LPXTG cell wall anchor domain-containing protein [Paeniclostridium sordellii]CEO12301.1 anchor protein [[Clostridium] sordellii] [Paeniclostridium sordellii]